MSKDLPLWYALAFFGPMLAAAFATPVAVRFAHRFDILDHPSGVRFHTTATPYLGGVALAIGLIAGAAVVSHSSIQLTVILVAYVGILDFGPRVSAPGGLVTQVVAQKIVALSAALIIVYQSYEADRALAAAPRTM